MNPFTMLRRITTWSRALRPLGGYWAAFVRFTIGVFFCITGATKLFDAGGRAQMVETLAASGIPFPEVNALVIAIIEFAGGGFLAIGLLTPICAAFLGGDMLVAIFTNRLKSVQGDTFFTWLDNFLYLPEVLYALILGWLLMAGPGKLSLDALFFRENSEAD